MQQMAVAMIQMQGQPVTLTPPGGTYDVATSTFTGNQTTVATTGVVLPLSRGLKHAPGTDIQEGDQQLLLPGNITQPAVDTKAHINGNDYIITEVDPVAPNGTPVYFDCIVRSGK